MGLAITRTCSATVLVWLVSIVGFDEALLLLALGLIDMALWDLWRPGAYLVSGVVLLWIALPARGPFIERPQVSHDPQRRRTR